MVALNKWVSQFEFSFLLAFDSHFPHFLLFLFHLFELLLLLLLSADLIWQLCVCLFNCPQSSTPETVRWLCVIFFIQIDCPDSQSAVDCLTGWLTFFLLICSFWLLFYLKRQSFMLWFGSEKTVQEKTNWGLILWLLLSAAAAAA